MGKKEKQVIGVEEKPSLGLWIPLSIQHTFAMFSGICSGTYSVRNSGIYRVADEWYRDIVVPFYYKRKISGISGF